MQTIMIDFDGVIHLYSKGWAGGVIYDPPVEGAKEALTTLKNLGFRLVILTARQLPKSREAIEGWLKQYDIPYDDITNIKGPAVIYIDDRGFRFEGPWTKNLPPILAILGVGSV